MNVRFNDSFRFKLTNGTIAVVVLSEAVVTNVVDVLLEIVAGVIGPVVMVVLFRVVFKIEDVVETLLLVVVAFWNIDVDIFEESLLVSVVIAVILIVVLLKVLLLMWLVVGAIVVVESILVVGLTGNVEEVMIVGWIVEVKYIIWLVVGTKVVLELFLDDVMAVESVVDVKIDEFFVVTVVKFPVRVLLLMYGEVLTLIWKVVGARVILELFLVVMTVE